jgi:hypothetical protein
MMSRAELNRIRPKVEAEQGGPEEALVLLQEVDTLHDTMARARMFLENIQAQLTAGSAAKDYVGRAIGALTVPAKSNGGK